MLFRSETCLEERRGGGRSGVGGEGGGGEEDHEEQRASRKTQSVQSVNRFVPKPKQDDSSWICPRVLPAVSCPTVIIKPLIDTPNRRINLPPLQPRGPRRWPSPRRGPRLPSGLLGNGVRLGSGLRGRGAKVQPSPRQGGRLSARGTRVRADRKSVV